MLTHTEAETIVKSCIRHVRGFGGGVGTNQTLQEAGILTADNATFLRNVIATDEDIGVPSVRQHRINLTDLNFNLDTPVLGLMNTVLFFAFALNEAGPPLQQMAFTINASSTGDSLAITASSPTKGKSETSGAKKTGSSGKKTQGKAQTGKKDK